SGRLDHLPYQAGHWIDRDDFQTIAFDPIFLAWAEEGLNVRDYFPAGLPPLDEWGWTLNWDGFPEIDQTKAADADDKRVRNGTALISDIWSEREGANWREKVDRLADEVAYFRSKGLKHPYEMGAAAPVAVQPADPANEDEENVPPPPPAPR